MFTLQVGESHRYLVSDKIDELMSPKGLGLLYVNLS